MADDDAKARRTSKTPTGGPVKRAAPRKVAAKKAPSPKAAPVVRKAAVKKAPAAKGVTPAKKAAVRKAPAPAAVKNVAKKAPAKQAPVAPPPARDRGSLLAPRKKAAPPLRLAAEQTFDDDWKPTPEPVREDPAARVRAVLRQAALSLEGKGAPPPPARPATPAPPPVAAEPEPEEDEEEEEVTRVLVAPAVEDDFDDFDQDLEDEAFEAEAEDDVDEEDIEEELDEELEVEDEEELDDDTADDEGGEWAPPEVLDSESPMMSSSTSRPTPPPPPPLSPPLPLGTPPKHQTAADFTPPPAPSPTRRSETSTQEKKPGGRRLLKVLVALLIIVVVVGVGAYAFAKIRDDGVDYSKLKVGDCFDSSPSNEVRGVKVKPCEEEHNSEIFFLVNHPARPQDAYPGKDALVQFAADACLGAPLTEYLGVPLEQSKLKDFEIVPQESAWKDGRRVLVCGLDTGGEGTLTGSVKGTRR